MPDKSDASPLTVMRLAGHNTDLRDSHEYIQKEVWGAQIFTSWSSNRFDLVDTRLTEASNIVFYDSAHPTYLETICVH